MKKIFIILIILLVPMASALQCTIREACEPDETKILGMSNLSNAHAELPSYNNYPYSICCKGGTAECGQPFLRLSAETNAHVSKTTYQDYPFTACINADNINCDYANNCSNLGEDYVCLASISADSNAHIGDCNEYATKVCCMSRENIEDNPPSIDIWHYPSAVNPKDNVSYITNASDDYGISEINITIDDSTHSCYLSQCIFIGGPYSLGSTHQYNASATDTSGQTTITPTKSFVVRNAPPVIENVHAEQTTTDATFYADVYDPDGVVDKVFVCTDSSCSSHLCEMIQSGTYSCSHSINGLKFYYIFANDTLGAYTIKGAFPLSINEYIYVEIHFTEEDVVPKTPSGLLNFTKGMPIKFYAKAEIRNRKTNSFIESCDNTICDAKVNFHGEEKLAWNNQKNAWEGIIYTYTESCDSIISFSVDVKRKADKLLGTKTAQAFINCMPSIIVKPIERLVALGEKNKKVFNITIYNPLEKKTFEVEMKTDDENGFPLQWLELECKNPDCQQVNSNKLIINVSKLMYNIADVKLETAGRAGMYPIKFIATDISNNKKYESDVRLSIYASELPEFSFIHILILILISGIVFAKTRKRKYIA